MNGRCGPYRCTTEQACAPIGPAQIGAVQFETAQLEKTAPDGVAERDWQVLQELARGDDAQVGFQGIKRRLDLHPEALRRVLKRMQREGWVTKESLGYRLTDAGNDLVATADAPRAAERAMPIASLLTPSHVTPDRVVQALARRWFDGLHWYGLSEGTGERTLTWLTEGDDQPLRIRVGLGGLRIEAALGHGDPDDRLRAAAPLLAALAEVLRAPAPGRSQADGDAPHFAA